jgi:hypothetical protein
MRRIAGAVMRPFPSPSMHIDGEVVGKDREEELL